MSDKTKILSRCLSCGWTGAPGAAQCGECANTNMIWTMGAIEPPTDAPTPHPNPRARFPKYVIDGGVVDDDEIDAQARAQVERELFEAGITEDPDVDGGILG